MAVTRPPKRDGTPDSADDRPRSDSYRAPLPDDGISNLEVQRSLRARGFATGDAMTPIESSIGKCIVVKRRLAMFQAAGPSADPQTYFTAEEWLAIDGGPRVGPPAPPQTSMSAPDPNAHYLAERPDPAADLEAIANSSIFGIAAMSGSALGGHDMHEVAQAAARQAPADQMITALLGRMPGDEPVGRQEPTRAPLQPTRIEETIASEDALVQIVGRGQGPTLAWRPNADGSIRNIEEATTLAKHYGVDIPEDIRFVPVDLKTLRTGRDKDKAIWAKYSVGTGLGSSGSTVTWDSFYHDQFEDIPVRLARELLGSDEGAVALIAHEMYELNALRAMFKARGGTMPAEEVRNLIEPGIEGNLHDRAWDAADEVVKKMRAEAK